MTFEEKISIILRTNKLGIATPEALSEFCGFNRDTIRKAIERGSQLNRANTRIFTDKLGINPVWWETGKGDVYLKNHAPVQNGSDNKENLLLGSDVWEASVFRKIIEGGAEYMLVPKTAFEGNHRFTSVEQIELQAKELEQKSRDLEQRAKEAAAKDEEIKNLTRAFIELVKEMRGLSSLPNFPKVEETKKDATI